MSLQRISIANILCPTDFSAFSEAAMIRAAAIARWFHARVTLLHTIPYSSPIEFAGASDGDTDARDPKASATLRADAAAKVWRFATPHLAAGTRIEVQVAQGEPWREIASAARELRADLVVMGTHGREGWQRLLLGSTTEKLARRLECPMLSVGPTTTATQGLLFRKILCALDLRHESHQTIDLAFAVAEENLAEVTLFHVLDGTPASWDAERPAVPSKDASRAGSIKAATAELRELTERSWTFCRTDARVSSGTPWREITRMANDIGADLIVMGANGRHGSGNPLLGATADQVMRHASCPVLLARLFGYRQPPEQRGPGVTARATSL